MQFKKVDVLISENLTKAQLKEKVLTELNKISKESNPSISYIANIHDIVNGKYWICMDSETKETMGAADELIDLQAIFRHTTENPDEASRDLLYSSKYIEDNFLRKIIFETYKEANDSRLTKLETTVDTNEKDIEDKHYKLEKRVTISENTITDNRKLEDTRYDEYTQFKKDIENNILSINNNLNTKANLGGSETQVFNVADPKSDWHAINLAYAKKNFNADLINTHKIDFNNPHKTSITNLIDTSIVGPANNHILQYDSNTRKWKNAVLSVDLSNYYNKSEVDSKLDTKANASNVYNKSEINTKFNSYYNKSAVDSFMELKANVESVYDKSEIDTKLQDVLTQADNRYSTLLTQNLEWTVGEGGKFTDLQTAINEASKLIQLNGSILTIKLLEDINISQYLRIIAKDLRFLNIDFNGFKIISSQQGIVLRNALLGALININLNTATNSIYLDNATINTIGDITIESGYDCIVAGAGSVLNIQRLVNVNLTPLADRVGLYIQSGSIATGEGLNITQNVGTVFSVTNSGIVCIRGATFNGSATQSNQPFNQWTTNGFIAK